MCVCTQHSNGNDLKKAIKLQSQELVAANSKLVWQSQGSTTECLLRHQVRGMAALTGDQLNTEAQNSEQCQAVANSSH